MNSKKKKTKTVIFIVVAAVLALAVSVCAVPVSSYFSGLNTPLPEAAPPEDIPDSVIAEVITDEEVEKLLSGETSLEDLESSLFEQGAADIEQESLPDADESPESAEPQPEKDAVSSSASTAPASSAASDKAASASSKPAADSGETAASSVASSSHTATADEPAYEAEVKALIQELYVLRAKALADLDACIKSAKAEFHSLPKEQQTKTKKISIAFSYAGQLTRLQSYYDKEVDRIVDEMRTTLKANGQSTELADEAMASYKSQKSEMYSTLLKKLYD